MRAAVLAPALLLLVSTTSVLAAPPPPVAVTSCGQVIPKRTLGYLTADLDCTGFTGGPTNVSVNYSGAAVYLERKSRLDLRGFTLTGGRWGVLCDALLCRNNHACSRGPCEVFNGTLVASDPSFNGIMGHRPVVHDVTVTGFYFGVVSYNRLSLSNATIQDSGGSGVVGRSLTITGTTVTGSGYFGVNNWTDLGARLRLVDSSVTGSGTGTFCGQQPCADVAAVRAPKLSNTTCDTSFRHLTYGTWNVCALD